MGKWKIIPDYNAYPEDMTLHEAWARTRKAQEVAEVALDLLEDIIEDDDVLYPEAAAFLAQHRVEECRIVPGGPEGQMCFCPKCRQPLEEPSEVVYIKTDQRTHDVVRATVQEMKRNGEI